MKRRYLFKGCRKRWKTLYSGTSWLPGTTTCGRGNASRKRRAWRNCDGLARCVRSPETTTTSGKSLFTKGMSAATTRASVRPKCRSDRCTSVFIASPSSRDDHSQRAGPNTVAQWRFHLGHLAVGSHLQASVVCVNQEILRADHFEVARLIQSLEQREQRQAQKAEAARTLRDVQRQFALIERTALTNLKALHDVTVVPDKNKRCAPLVSLAFEVDPHRQERITPRGCDACLEQRTPFAVTEPALPPFALAHDVGVQTQAGIVDEDAIVDFAHVNVEYMA